VSDHKRTDTWVSFLLLGVAACCGLLVAGTALAGGGAPGPTFRPVNDFNKDGASDVLLMKVNTPPNVGINETDIVSGTLFSARGWPDLNMSAAGVEYTTRGAGVFDGNGFDQAQILTRKTAGANLGLVRIVQLDATGTAPSALPSQFFVGGTDLDWSFLGIGDCDGNGTDDIVFHKTTAPNVGLIRIVFMNPTDFTVMTTQHPGSLTAMNVPIGVADADGDGQADIWTMDTGTSAVEILINAPDVTTGGVFETAQMPMTVLTGYQVAGIGVIDRADAQADLVTESKTAANPGLVRIDHTGMNGGATGAAAPVWPALLDQTISESVSTVGDYNGADQEDLLTRMTTPVNPANNGALTIRLLNANGDDVIGAGNPATVNPLSFDVIDGAPILAP